MAPGERPECARGEWTNGPIPIGYDLDQDGRLVPSARKVNGLDLTEAELAADLFTRIAEGSTNIVQSRRFNTLGVPLTRRYGGGKEVLVSMTGVWPVSRINFIVRNLVYKGLHVLMARGGPIEREVPALVSPELWQAANDRLKRKKVPGPTQGHAQELPARPHPLRRSRLHVRRVAEPRQELAQLGRLLLPLQLAARRRPPRPDEALPGEDDPRRVPRARGLAGLPKLHLSPGEALAEAQRQLRERLEQAAGIEAEWERLQELLAEKEAERERGMTLFRRGYISLSEAGVQLDAVGREMADLRALSDSLAAQVGQGQLPAGAGEGACAPVLARGEEVATPPRQLRLLN